MKLMLTFKGLNILLCLKCFITNLANISSYLSLTLFCFYNWVFFLINFFLLLFLILLSKKHCICSCRFCNFFINRLCPNLFFFRYLFNLIHLKNKLFLLICFQYFFYFLGVFSNWFNLLLENYFLWVQFDVFGGLEFCFK